MAVAADFSGTPLSGTVPFDVAFTDASTGTPDTWDWDFGDGSPHGTTQNPTHSYAASGVYTVTLIATDSSGPTSDTKVRAAYVTANKGVTAAQTGHGADVGPVVGAAATYVATYRVNYQGGGGALKTLSMPAVGSAAAARKYFWKNIPAADQAANVERIDVIDVRPATGAEAVQ